MKKKKEAFKYKNSKFNKSLQKIKRNRIIDQKTIRAYKKHLSSLNQQTEDIPEDTDQPVPTAKRNVIIRPDSVIVSKIDSEVAEAGGLVENQEDAPAEGKEPAEGRKKLSKWKRIKSEFQKAEADRLSEIKESKKMKRNKRKNRIHATKLLTSTNKKGQPIMNDVMKHLLNKLKNN